MRNRLIGLLVGLVLTLPGFLASPSAHANHLTYLPLVPNTWLMLQVKATQEQLWCVDSRAENYPGFLTQLRDVNDAYTRLVGIRNRQVSIDDPACQVRHLMPDSFDCGGCAANVFYANRPVTINYKWQLGYVDWRTAQGHELGHALLGLHEQYNDSSGQISCTGRTDTVMDCGSPVRYPTVNRDVVLGCSLYGTPWCGMDGSPPPPPPPPPCDPCWDGTDWVFSSGWRTRPSTGEWFDPYGRLFWLNADQYGWRFSPVMGGAWPGGTPYWTPEFGHLIEP